MDEQRRLEEMEFLIDAKAEEIVEAYQHGLVDYEAFQRLSGMCHMYLVARNGLFHETTYISLCTAYERLEKACKKAGVDFEGFKAQLL